jgi:hypothetical protein
MPAPFIGTDQRTGKAAQLDSFNMTLSQRGFDSALAGNGSAVWHGEKLTHAVRIDKPRALLDGAESQVEVDLAAAPLTLSFTSCAASANLIQSMTCIASEHKRIEVCGQLGGASGASANVSPDS